jgi:hypothetical protein
MPTITCTAPVCANPGDEVVLAPTCTSSNPNATLVYYVDGREATTATCPFPGTTTTVTVKPKFLDFPNCPYDSKTAFTLNGVCVGGAAGEEGQEQCTAAGCQHGL